MCPQPYNNTEIYDEFCEEKLVQSTTKAPCDPFKCFTSNPCKNQGLCSLNVFNCAASCICNHPFNDTNIYDEFCEERNNTDIPSTTFAPNSTEFAPTSNTTLDSGVTDDDDDNDDDDNGGEDEGEDEGEGGEGDLHAEPSKEEPCPEGWPGCGEHGTCYKWKGK